MISCTGCWKKKSFRYITLVPLKKMASMKLTLMMEKYIGKGSHQRMQQSIKRLSSETRNLVLKQFTPCSSDKAAFILEHIKMMEAGFGTEGCVLLNKIYSPGMKLLMMFF